MAADQKANTFAVYEAMLRGWGIDITPEVRSFINKAINGGWGSSLFLLNLRDTKFYAQAFPGLVRRDGTIRMSEAQYLSYTNQVRDIASQFGMNLSRQQIGVMVGQGISAWEARDRLAALDSMRANRDMLQNFAAYLDANGLAPKGGISRKDLFKFVMREGPAEWEKAWDNAYAATQIEDAGIGIGPGEDIGIKKLGRILKNAPPGFDVTKLDYAGLAQMVIKVLPASQIYKAGITKKALIKLAIGGPEAEPIAERVRRVLATYSSRFEGQALPQLNQGGLMTGASRNVQATE
jgi:hypothetical protein